MIGIINYGSGNINAIANIHKRFEIPFMLVNKPDDLDQCSKLILPGVGDFDETMRLLTESGLKAGLNQYVLEKKLPIIGFCVGMQIMGFKSEEGSNEGFGWIPGNIKKLDINSLERKPYLPHMGWNTINIKQDHLLFDGLSHVDGFYFLHSYYFECRDSTNILSTTNYGNPFPSVVRHENIFGIQFHPEKSHENGMQIFRNFSKL